MILGRFVARKFLGYGFTVAIFFPALYTLIECLEKYARYQNVAAGDFFTYGAFYYIPAFIDLFPLSMLLAMGLFLREILLKNYCEQLAVYAISLGHLIRHVGILSLILAVGVAVCHECVGVVAAYKVAVCKRTIFKRTSQSDGWFQVGATLFFIENEDGSLFGFESGEQPALILLDGLSHDVHVGKSYSFQHKKRESFAIKNVLVASRKMLTQRLTETSLIRLGTEKFSICNDRMWKQFLIFYLKIVFWPLFVLIWFLVFYEKKILRWGGFFGAYAQTGIASLIVQVGLSWHVLGVFLFVMIIICAYGAKQAL